jgi:glucose/arabinose dehydrogenase
MRILLHKSFRQFLSGIILMAFCGLAKGQPLLSYNPVVNSGLSSPVDIANAGDGTNRIFVVQRGGTVRIYNGTTFAFIGTFLTLSGNFTTGGERGLLSIAFHPDYENNRYFFVYYTNGAGGVNIDRFQTQLANPNAADFTTRTNIMSFTKPVVYGNHNGGDLNFGPDGNLYFGLGDSGDSGDPGNLAQNGNSYWGKMMRINVDNFTTPPYYTVPATNPYISDPAVLDEIWCIGLRNPWRWSFDRQTGDMWIGDVGQGNREEVNYQPASNTGGKNYGWRCYEGTAAFNTGGCQAQNTYTAPIFDYPHNNATGGFSITGGFVYRGAEFAFLNGYYICADYVSGNAWLIKDGGTSGGFTSSIQAGLPASISTFGEAENGDIYTANLGGTLYKVNATAPIPVTLTGITAQNNNGSVLVKWQTSFEQNTSRFEVQYNADGSNWQTAGSINASGQPNGSSYSFIHNFTVSSNVLYRLKIIDNNGSFTYSPTVSLNNITRKKVLVYPSLIQDNVLRIALDAPFTSLQMVDANGREVYRQNISGRTGTVQLNLPALAAGIYSVVVKNAQEVVVQKVVVK